MPHRLGRRLRPECLESRRLLADLGLGIVLIEDNPSASEPQPAAIISDPLEVGQTFWVAIVATDLRGPGDGDPAGISALPLNVAWDSDDLELVAPSLDEIGNAMGPLSISPDSLLITGRFDLNRSLNAFNPNVAPLTDMFANLTDEAIRSQFQLERLAGFGLQSASDPTASVVGRDAISDSASTFDDLEPNVFSAFRMRALQADPLTRFTIRLDGSASLADTAVIDNVVGLDQFDTSTLPPQVLTNAVRRMIAVDDVDVLPASLSGNVFIDSNNNLQFENNEFGLPSVTIELFRDGGLIATALTDADGRYQFDGLEPGEYTLRQVQPQGFTSVGADPGQVTDTGNMQRDEGNVVSVDEIGSIVLDEGDQGTNYDFAERLINVTKRMFLTSTDPRIEFCDESELQCGRIRGSDGDDLVRVMRQYGLATIQINNASPIAIDSTLLDVLFIDLGAGDDTVLFDDRLSPVSDRDALLRINSERETASLAVPTQLAANEMPPEPPIQIGVTGAESVTTVDDSGGV
ncbi:MAG: SdrD B-like domain-containing protein [Planctomycetota bacterium]